MRHIFSPRNRKKTLKEWIKYFLVSLTGGALNLIILYVLTEFFGVYYIISAAIGFIVGGINNFTLDKIWVFKENIEDEYSRKYFHFLCISIFAYALSLLILYLLTEFVGIYYIFSQIIAKTTGGSLNFVFNKLYTFKSKKKKKKI